MHFSSTVTEDNKTVITTVRCMNSWTQLYSVHIIIIYSAAMFRSQLRWLMPLATNLAKRLQSP